MVKNRIVALDIGDVWTGVALSDNMHILASPHKTVETKEIFSFLTDFFQELKILQVVVGMPITLSGTESEQTKKTKKIVEQLRIKFPSITFIPFDERLSSAAAVDIQKSKKKGTIKKRKAEKLKNHAIAAAIILTDYLQTFVDQEN